MLKATFRPLSTWPGRRTPFPEIRSDPFRAGYAATLDLLETELDRLDAKEIVIQVALTQADLRNDGWPRATARPSAPGVVLSFRGAAGPLQFACDSYCHWEANLRAIALTLQALRAVDRYGCTQDRQQYRGYGALPPGEGYVPPPPLTLTLDEAARLVAAAAGFRPASVLADAAVFQAARRAAVKAAHPDTGGGHEQFLRLTAAVGVLEAHHAGRRAA